MAGLGKGHISSSLPISAIMTRKSRKRRSPLQMAQVSWMGGFRHGRPSPNEIEVWQLANPSPNARGRQKLAREVAEVKKDLRNSERREKRTREKFEAMKVDVEDTEMAVQVVSDENDLLRRELDELTRRNAELKQEVKLKLRNQFRYVP